MNWRAMLPESAIGVVLCIATVASRDLDPSQPGTSRLLAKRVW